MKLFALILLNGLSLGALYFIVACGFSLIFGLLRTVNLAHGSLYLAGAYIGYQVSFVTESWFAGLLAGAIASAILGVFMQTVLLRSTAGDTLRQALLTVGFSIVVADVLLAIFGGLAYQFEPPAFMFGTTELPIVQGYPTMRIAVIAFAFIIGTLLWLVLNRTKLGMAIRAGVDDRVMLSALGFNVNILYVLVFALGAFLAGLAGTIGGSVFSVAPGEDARFLLSSLVVVIVGGMGSLGGAALGAMLVGLTEQAGLALFPNYATSLTFGLMVAVLAIRPQGLFGRA